MSKAHRSKQFDPSRHQSHSSSRFCNGETIPRTGLYSLWHSEHRLPKDVTLRKGEVFPSCSACSGKVYFRLVKAAPADSDDKAFKVVLYVLPVLEEEDSATGTGAVA